MAKAKTNAGNANKSGAGKRATMTRTTKTTAAKRTAAKTAAKPAARTTAQRAATKTAAKRSHKARAQEGASSARLRPITERQSRNQIIATVARDTGIASGTVGRVANSLGNVYMRHLMKDGSGQVEILGAHAALYRGKEGPRKQRKMWSPLLQRDVVVKARGERAVPRLRARDALRAIVART